MLEWVNTWPFWAVYVGLFCVALARGQGTYLLARWAHHVASNPGARSAKASPGVGVSGQHNGGRVRRRVAAALAGPRFARGQAIMSRYGLVAVPLCYATVGLQTVVLATCGALAVPWVRFTCAQIPGAALWAGIYSTVGLAAWTAAVAAAAGSPAGWAVIAVGIASIILLVRRRPFR